MDRPNIIFLMVDQLASQVLKIYDADLTQDDPNWQFAQKGKVGAIAIEKCNICNMKSICMKEASK